MGLIVAAILVVLAMIGLARPYIGLLALLIVIELQPGELYPYLAPLHLERVVAAMLLVAFLVHGAKWRFPAPTRWFLAFYGAMVLSVPLAFWRAGAFFSCIGFLEVVFYVVCATALLTTESRIRWFILTYVLLIDWLGGSALWNYSHGIWQVRMHIERAIGITSSAGDPNTMAATLLFSIPLSVALMTRSNPIWMRFIGLGSSAMCVVTIIDTGSRGAAMGIVFLVLLLLARRPQNLIFLPVLLCLAPVVWMVIPQQYKARYETVDHLKSDASYQNRLLSWEGGVKMFESNPLTGIGAGDYTSANGVEFWPGDGQKRYLNAHSLYFKVLGELGLLGIVTFGGYLICVFRLNIRLGRELEHRDVSKFLKVLPGTFTIMLLQMLFAGYASHDLYRSTWFVIGAMAASVSLLPVMQHADAGSKQSMEIHGSRPDAGRSPALLPALRNRIPLENPPS
jgi:probable O-glycosylation ligase (exosortase A-associated)